MLGKRFPYRKMVNNFPTMSSNNYQIYYDDNRIWWPNLIADVSWGNPNTSRTEINVCTNISICSEREWNFRPPALKQNDNNQDWFLGEEHLYRKTTRFERNVFTHIHICSKHEPNSHRRSVLRELSSSFFSSSRNILGMYLILRYFFR